MVLPETQINGGDPLYVSVTSANLSVKGPDGESILDYDNATYKDIAKDSFDIEKRGGVYAFLGKVGGEIRTFLNLDMSALERSGESLSNVVQKLLDNGFSIKQVPDLRLVLSQAGLMQGE